jgi:hypothetical protein
MEQGPLWVMWVQAPAAAGAREFVPRGYRSHCLYQQA